MPDTTATREARVASLRLEIKAWERDFLTARGGKPTRKDIAANKNIGRSTTCVWPGLDSLLTMHSLSASKYKEYEALKLNPSTDAASPSRQPRKRKSTDAHNTTPTKRPARDVFTPRKAHTAETQWRTPSKSSRVIAAPDAEEEVLAEATPPMKPLMLGPTPQKNGIPLGIFDLLPTSTPKRDRTALGDIDANLLCTPSRIPRTPESVYTGRRHSRTPMSDGKRFVLDHFVTPRKDKENKSETPSSIARRFMTPSFLRRHTEPLPPLAEGEESPERPKPWRKRGLFRSLSSIIQSRRDEEVRKEDQAFEGTFEDELDVLREMEQEDAIDTTNTQPALQPLQPQKPQNDNAAKKRDSGVELDRDGFLPEPEPEANNPNDATKDGQPGIGPKVWKKKGLKRQTKRVISKPNKTFMQSRSLVLTLSVRPVRTRPSQAQEPEEASSDEEASKETGANNGAEEQPEFEQGAKTGSDKAAKGRKKSSKSTEAAEPPKKAGRKIKADAHANYRRLKIKSKNSKGNGRGRFGRRR
jgi:hypothetical protein